MGEEELGASFSVESFFAEEAVTPAVFAPPPAKRVCAAGSSSSAPVAPPAASVVPHVPPVMAPAADPSSAAPPPSTSTQKANPVAALAITGRYQRLRRNRKILRLPRRSYCRHMLQWPSADDANRFKQLMPITYRLSEGPTAEIKVYQDPAPDFSAAKARGETMLVLRNVPVGFAVHTLRSLLVSSASNGARWLA
ncbi:unnamed protein product [Closterium sp. NIES-65]|nr:unnamed protein product [Closterium sp. NIES-65]